MKTTLVRPLIIGYILFGIIGLIILSVDTSVYRPQMEETLLDHIYLVFLIIYLISFIILILFLIFIYIPLKKIIKASSSYADGIFENVIEVRRDDEIGRLADTMNYMAHELNSLEDDQRKFISNVSHDFRSPLTSIKGYAEAMADGTIPFEMQDKYLKIIVHESERLEKLTGNLLELNKYGAKGFFLDISEFDLNQLIRQTASSFEGTCGQKKIAVSLKLAEDILLVKADSSKIDQVLHNLIDNAIKFSHTESVITISTDIRNGKVFVSVKDNGIGIPRESLSKIWDRFYKTDLSRGKDKRGTGLGLSIVREIIHAHNENINVISTEGVGTEFIFSLPVSESGQKGELL